MYKGVGGWRASHIAHARVGVGGGQFTLSALGEEVGHVTMPTLGIGGMSHIT